MARKAPKSFTEKHNVTQELADVIGKTKASRGEVTSLVWKYIHAQDLQDCRPGHKRTIKPDACLAKVVGRKPIDMFKMTSAVSKHILD